jgi:hypothetical protein
MRVCLWCKKELTGASTKKFCGGACRTAASKARKAASEQVSTKACQWCEKEAQKPVTILRGRCEHCGSIFKAARKTKRFCDDECRVDARFKALGIDYTSDPDFVQLRNWWLYKHRTESGIYDEAYQRYLEAKIALESTGLDEDAEYGDYVDTEDAETLDILAEFEEAKANQVELVKSRSIDKEAVERGAHKLRLAFMRQRDTAAYEALKPDMEEMSDYFTRE